MALLVSRNAVELRDADEVEQILSGNEIGTLAGLNGAQAEADR